ncbi:hypothetical protein [Arthrobacter sp. EM1]|uniref:hypothetical protein n=1 Tax=Arthrobacter sp. EM1 TaxID=3043847 RepID=UPI0032B8360F
MVSGRSIADGRRTLRFATLVFDPAAVVAGDAVLDLAPDALHAGEEFLLDPSVPLTH